MKPMRTAGRVSLMLLSLVVLAPSAVMGADETFRLSAPRFWWGNWAVPSWISLAGDADGDGRAELVAIDPPGTIAVARTSPLGKWAEDPEHETRFGNNLVAAVVARFMGGAGEQVVALGREGGLLMASGASAAPALTPASIASARSLQPPSPPRSRADSALISTTTAALTCYSPGATASCSCS